MEQAARQFFRLLVAIFDVCVAVPLLWYFIGWQPLIGIMFLFLLVPFGGFLSYLSGKLRLKTAVISDRRINLMTEIVAGIREVKTHAWEWFFRDKIKETRRLVEQDRLAVSGFNRNVYSVNSHKPKPKAIPYRPYQGGPKVSQQIKPNPHDSVI